MQIFKPSINALQKNRKRRFPELKFENLDKIAIYSTILGILKKVALT
jgi:hypothetical protein